MAASCGQQVCFSAVQNETETDSICAIDGHNGSLCIVSARGMLLQSSACRQGPDWTQGDADHRGQQPN